MSLVLGHYQSHSSCVFSIIGGVCPWFLGAVPGSPHICFLRNHWGFVSGFGAVPVSPQLCFVRNCWGLSLFFFFFRFWGSTRLTPALLQAQTQIQQQLFLRLQEEAQPLQGQRQILQVPKVQVQEQNQEVRDSPRKKQNYFHCRNTPGKLSLE